MNTSSRTDGYKDMVQNILLETKKINPVDIRHMEVRRELSMKAVEIISQVFFAVPFSVQCL